MALSPLAPPVEGLPYEDTPSLHDYWRALVRRRILILRCGGAFMALAVLVVLWLPNVYQSTVALIPLTPQKTSLLTSALGELGAGLLPSGLSPSTPSDLLLAILQSRTIAMDVTQHLNLLPVLFASDWNSTAQKWQTDDPPTLQDAVRELDKIVSFNVDKKSVVTIKVEHVDSVLAAAIANCYATFLQQILDKNTFSLAKKNRLFITAQLEQTRRDLEHAEEALKQFEQTYGIVDIQTQTETGVKALAAIREQIIGREVQLSVQQRLLKGASPEVYLLEEELRALRTQLERLYHGTSGHVPPSSDKTLQNEFWITVDAAPDIKLRYTSLQREALVLGKVFGLFTQQLEQAKIDEERNDADFQVLDHAIPADRESKPKRVLIVVLAAVIGAFVGALLVLVRESLDTTIRSKEQVERLVGLPLLAATPVLTWPERWLQNGQVSHGQSSVSPSLALHVQPPEAVRYLYTRLRHRNGQQRIQMVLLTSAGPDDNTALLLAHLAMVATSAGESTLIIDANLQHPTLHILLHCSAKPGLAEMLTDPAHWQQGIQHTAVHNIHVVAAGTPQATTSLDVPAFDTLLAHYKAAYGLILCAAPPLSGSTDAAVLGNKADATCLVLTYGVSRLDTTLEVKSALEAVHANVSGAILTDCGPEYTR